MYAVFSVKIKKILIAEKYSLQKSFKYSSRQYVYPEIYNTLQASCNCQIPIQINNDQNTTYKNVQ